MSKLYYVIPDDLYVAAPRIKILFAVQSKTLYLMTENDHHFARHFSQKLALDNANFFTVSSNANLELAIHFLAQQVLQISGDRYDLSVEGTLTESLRSTEVHVVISPDFLQYVNCGLSKGVGMRADNVPGGDTSLMMFARGPLSSPFLGNFVRQVSIDGNNQQETRIKYQLDTSGSRPAITPSGIKKNLHVSFPEASIDFEGEFSLPYRYLYSGGAAAKPLVISTNDSGSVNTKSSKFLTLAQNLRDRHYDTFSSRVHSLRPELKGTLGYGQSNSGGTASSLNTAAGLLTKNPRACACSGLITTRDVNLMIGSSANSQRFISLILGSLPMLAPEVDTITEGSYLLRCYAAVAPASVELCGDGNDYGSVTSAELKLEYRSPSSQYLNYIFTSPYPAYETGLDPYRWTKKGYKSQRGLETSRGAAKFSLGNQKQLTANEVKTGSWVTYVLGFVVGYSAVLSPPSTPVSFGDMGGAVYRKSGQDTRSVAAIASAIIVDGPSANITFGQDGKTLTTNVIGAII